jgi:hypothetical protein
MEVTSTSGKKYQYDNYFSHRISVIYPQCHCQDYKIIAALAYEKDTPRSALLKTVIKDYLSKMNKKELNRLTNLYAMIQNTK